MCTACDEREELTAAHQTEMERLFARFKCTCGHEFDRHALGRPMDGGSPLLTCLATGCGCDLFTGSER